MSKRALSDDRGSAFTPKRWLATECSVRAVNLGPRDNLLAHLAAQRESGFDIELSVNECIERRIARVARHVIERLGITRKQVRHHRRGGARCACVPRWRTRRPRHG